MRILEQTREAVQHSRIMETKNEELKTLTFQLTTANNQLKQLDRLKADFITTVTHELRTPVTSIKALSKIMLDDYERLDKERRTAYLQIIVNESDRISRLINQVLDIEKLRSEDALQQIEPVELTEVMLTAVSGMQQLFTERHITCTLPDTDGNWTVLGDKDKLIQVVVNLLSNALKFCDPADGRITIGLQRKGQYALLSVRDNGPGIPEKSREMIFEQFTQLHSKEQGKPHGTGLGLFITKKIVEQHHGAIRVESEPGEGALFEIKLPLNEPLSTVLQKSGH
jgi:signal transduction histidine kinase